MAMSSVIGALRVTLGLDTAAFTKGLSGVNKQMASVGRSMQKAGKTLSATVSAPILAFGALTLKTAGDFQQGMNRVAAVSGATEEQLKKLSDQAKELGRTTQFSASQAADAMGFLAQAGFKADQIFDAMPGTLQLAAAAQMDLGQTADVVSNILQGYGKEVSELNHVNDVLVKAFTSANTNLEQLGEAMKYAGPVASAAGVQFETAAAALSMMGNAGIQASMAGTSLRGAISRILNPTAQMKAAMEEAGLSFTDSAGKLLPLADIIRELEPHADNAGLFMLLFGQRAGPAMSALVEQGADALTKLTGELENSGGTAKRIADVQMQGFNGAMRELRSAFEGLQIAIAESGFIEWMTDAIKSITQWVQRVSESNPEMLKWGTIIAGLAAVIGPLVGALGIMVVGIAAITAPVALVIAGIAALVAGIVYFRDELKAAHDTAREFQLALHEWLVDKLAPIWEAVKGGIDGVKSAFSALYEAVVGHSYIPDMVNEVGVHMDRMAQEMPAAAKIAADGVVANITQATGAVAEFGAKTSAVRASVLTDMQAIDKEMQEHFKSTGDNVRATTSLIQGTFDTLQDRLADSFEKGEVSFEGFLDALKRQAAQFLADKTIAALGSFVFGGGSSSGVGGGGLISGLFGGGGGTSGGSSGIGGTVGAAVGSIFGPLGTAAGGVLGNIAGSIFGFAEGGSFTVGGPRGMDRPHLLGLAGGERVDITPAGDQFRQSGQVVRLEGVRDDYWYSGKQLRKLEAALRESFRDGTILT